MSHQLRREYHFPDRVGVVHPRAYSVVRTHQKKGQAGWLGQGAVLEITMLFIA